MPRMRRAFHHLRTGATARADRGQEEWPPRELRPLSHERASSAVRYLAGIALDQKNFKDAGFWLARGQEEYGERFLDSWVDYALTQVAINEKNSDKVRTIRTAAAAKYPPSDPWVTMLNAAAEAFEWSQAKGVE